MALRNAHVSLAVLFLILNSFGTIIARNPPILFPQVTALEGATVTHCSHDYKGSALVGFIWCVLIYPFFYPRATVD